MMEDYNLCFAEFRARGEWTTNRELNAGSDRCYAAALAAYQRKQNRWDSKKILGKGCARSTHAVY